MLSLLEKLNMYSFFVSNKDNPEALARYYFKHKLKVEALKKEYPDWSNYVSSYPDLCSELRKLGVPL